MELSAKTTVICAPIWKPVKHLLWKFIVNIVIAVDFFREKPPSYPFDDIPNTPLECLINR